MGVLTVAVVVIGVVVGVWFSRRPVPEPSAAPPVASGGSEHTTEAGPAPPPPPAVDVSPGLLSIDATPWANVVAVRDAQGNNRAANQNWVTPLGLQLQPGKYKVTLKDSSSPAVTDFDVEIVSGQTAKTSHEFRRVSVDRYFRDAGFQVEQ